MKHFLKRKNAVSFFLFDAAIAAIVFFMAVAIILSSINREPEIETPKIYADGIMNYYLETEVSDIENDYISQLLANKEIENPSNTILEQMIIFYAENKDEINYNFTREISIDKIPTSFGFNIGIINATGDTKGVYARSSVTSDLTSKMNLKRIVITQKEDGEIIGPFIVSVNVWY